MKKLLMLGTILGLLGNHEITKAMQEKDIEETKTFMIQACNFLEQHSKRELKAFIHCDKDEKEEKVRKGRPENLERFDSGPVSIVIENTLDLSNYTRQPNEQEMTAAMHLKEVLESKGIKIEQVKYFDVHSMVATMTREIEGLDSHDLTRMKKLYDTLNTENVKKFVDTCCSFDRNMPEEEISFIKDVLTNEFCKDENSLYFDFLKTFIVQKFMKAAISADDPFFDFGDFFDPSSPKLKFRHGEKFTANYQESTITWNMIQKSFVREFNVFTKNFIIAESDKTRVLFHELGHLLSSSLFPQFEKEKEDRIDNQTPTVVRIDQTFDVLRNMLPDITGGDELMKTLFEDSSEVFQMFGFNLSLSREGKMTLYINPYSDFALSAKHGYAIRIDHFGGKNPEDAREEIPHIFIPEFFKAMLNVYGETLESYCEKLVANNPAKAAILYRRI